MRINIDRINQRISNTYMLFKGMMIYKFRSNRNLYHLHIIIHIIRKTAPVIMLIFFGTLFSELNLNQRPLYCPSIIYDNQVHLMNNPLTWHKRQIIKNVIQDNDHPLKMRVALQHMCRKLKVHPLTTDLLLRTLDNLIKETYYYDCRDPGFLTDNVLLQSLEKTYGIQIFDTFNMLDLNNQRVGYGLRNGYSLIISGVLYLTRRFDWAWIRAFCFGYTFFVLSWAWYILDLGTQLYLEMGFIPLLKLFFHCLLFLRLYIGDCVRPDHTWFNLLRCTNLLTLTKTRSTHRWYLKPRFRPFSEVEEGHFPRCWLTNNLKNRMYSLIQNAFSGPSNYWRMVNRSKTNNGFFKLQLVESSNHYKFQTTYGLSVFKGFAMLAYIVSQGLESQFRILEEYSSIQNTYYCLKQWVPRGITHIQYALALVIIHNFYEKVTLAPAYLILLYFNYHTSVIHTFFNPFMLVSQFLIVCYCIRGQPNEEVTRKCYRNGFLFMSLYCVWIPLIVNLSSSFNNRTTISCKTFFGSWEYSYEEWSLKAFIVEHIFTYLNSCTQGLIEPEISIYDPLVYLFYL